MLDKDNIQVQIDKWVELIDSLLTAHPQGISEHGIILELRHQGYLLDLEDEEAPMGGLFAVHFLVMYVLYGLQKKGRQESESDMTIGPLNIQRHSYRQGEQALTSPDELSSYYLDLDNLFSTSEDEVNQWLDNFWERYLADDERQDAIKVLGLSEPISREGVETKYRQLAMKHHPDRGGETARLAEINHAVEVLRKLVKK